MNIQQLEKEINAIKERNRRVEAGKEWETSWTRKIVIATLTYFVISVFFVFVGVSNPWVNSIVPTTGFLLSTLSLSYLKKFWLRYIYKN